MLWGQRGPPLRSTGEEGLSRESGPKAVGAFLGPGAGWCRGTVPETLEAASRAGCACPALLPAAGAPPWALWPSSSAWDWPLAAVEDRC